MSYFLAILLFVGALTFSAVRTTTQSAPTTSQELLSVLLLEIQELNKSMEKKLIAVNQNVRDMKNAISNLETAMKGAGHDVTST